MSNDGPDSSITTEGLGKQSKPLDEMDREELVAYIIGIQPTEDTDALKYLEIGPLLDRALMYKMQLDGLHTDDPTIKQLPKLGVDDVLTLKKARDLNEEFRKSLRKSKNRLTMRNGGPQDKNNNNNNNDINEDIGLEPLAGRKRNFKDYSNDARMDMLIKMGKDIDITDANAVKNFEKFSKALYGGNLKKKRRKGDSLVFLLLFIYLLFFLITI